MDFESSAWCSCSRKEKDRKKQATSSCVLLLCKNITDRMSSKQQRNNATNSPLFSSTNQIINDHFDIDADHQLQCMNQHQSDTFVVTNAPIASILSNDLDTTHFYSKDHDSFDCVLQESQLNDSISKNRDWSEKISLFDAHLSDESESEGNIKIRLKKNVLDGIELVVEDEQSFINTERKRNIYRNSLNDIFSRNSSIGKIVTHGSSHGVKSLSSLNIMLSPKSVNKSGNTANNGDLQRSSKIKRPSLKSSTAAKLLGINKKILIAQKTSSSFFDSSTFVFTTSETPTSELDETVVCWTIVLYRLAHFALYLGVVIMLAFLIARSTWLTVFLILWISNVCCILLLIVAIPAAFPYVRIIISRRTSRVGKNNPSGIELLSLFVVCAIKALGCLVLLWFEVSLYFYCNGNKIDPAFVFFPAFFMLSALCLYALLIWAWRFEILTFALCCTLSLAFWLVDASALYIAVPIFSFCVFMLIYFVCLIFLYRKHGNYDVACLILLFFAASCVSAFCFLFYLRFVVLELLLVGLLTGFPFMYLLWNNLVIFPDSSRNLFWMTYAQPAIPALRDGYEAI